MTQRQPFKQLFAIMAASAMLVSVISITSLYSAAISQYRLRLVETVKSRARLIEAIAHHEIEFAKDKTGYDALVATLQQLTEAQREFEGFVGSGEFALARREGDQIVFILSRRDAEADIPAPVPIKGDWAEPMRLALTGNSGVITGLDYRGVKVLAAHEPVSILGLGLVAKVDMSEVRAPFIRAGLIATTFAMLVIFIASRLFFRISRPIEEAIDQQAETFTTLAETAREGIVLADTRGIIQFVNRATEKLFGYRRGELIGSSVKRLMPEEHSSLHDGYMSNYLQTGIPRIIGTGRQLTGLRKDGHRFPVYLSIGDIRTSHARLFAGVIMDISEQQQLQREILEIPVREQRRIGQELHDGLGQQLTGLGLLATSLVNKASKPEHELATRLAAGLQEAIAQVRALSRGLIPVDIDAEGFMNSVTNLVEDIRSQVDIPIILNIAETVPIFDNTTAMHLYRIVQEALNNAIKHAGASEIRIGIGIEGNRGCLLVVDDGKGLDTTPEKSTGLGLRIMKHRCGLIDGELNIECSPVGGTGVKCYFPIEIEHNRRQ
ncbi:MAG: PAS domain S-box protein [Gammaproteobacteria bacterium]|nr:PAS domain S-box protein [Gammaproteobacteria bacterium]MDH3448812.1 PAS domain S-box protein [Gammaproteobacteria bacterium]